MSRMCPHKTVPEIVKEKHGVNVAATGVVTARGCATVGRCT